MLHIIGYTAQREGEDFFPFCIFRKFQSKIEILDKNRNFGQTSKFWTKIEILRKNRNFAQKSTILKSILGQGITVLYLLYITQIYYTLYFIIKSSNNRKHIIGYTSQAIPPSVKERKNVCLDDIIVTNIFFSFFFCDDTRLKVSCILLVIVSGPAGLSKMLHSSTGAP